MLSPAKVNLTLEVVKKLPTGFHKLRTVMLKLEKLRDEVTFSFNENSDRVLTKTSNEAVPDDQTNLCHRATQIFFNQTRLSVGVLIDIEKNIPVGAGLGGGSSNAATTFLALNKYFGSPIDDERLSRMASDLGKDIPFFLQKKNCALMGGMGDRLEADLNLTWDKSLVVVNPGIKILTPHAYGMIGEKLWYMSRMNRIDISGEFFRKLKKKELALNFLHNDFELGAINQYEEILDLKHSLRVFGAEVSLMSGSGSTVFGIFENQKLAREASATLKRKYPNYLIINC